MQIRYRAASDKLQVYSYGTSTNVMTIQKSNGFVGIGTQSPTAKLEVNSSDGTETLRLHKSDTNIVENEIIGEILFSTADSTLNADRKVIGAIKCFAEENFSGANSNEGSLQFFTANATDLRNSGSPTPRMVIDEDGNVGIGTTSPADKLHVSDTTAGNPLVSIRVQNSNGYSEFGTQSTYARILSQGTLLYAGSSNPQIWYINGSTAMTLDTDG